MCINYMQLHFYEYLWYITSNEIQKTEQYFPITKIEKHTTVYNIFPYLLVFGSLKYVDMI